MSSKVLKSSGARAFTLIELLIVVAIIAILAAIAVPNFLEAQTRSKVSRCAADMRSLKTGIESYRVDNNHYPETDYGTGVNQPLGSGAGGAGMHRLSTPIAYMSSIPKSPFKESAIGGAARHSNTLITFLYVRARPSLTPAGTVDSGTPDSGLINQVDDNYERDRICYVSQNASLAANNAIRALGEYEIKSVGPNNVDDQALFGISTQLARAYDPTNGTVSQGDVVTFGDVSGFARGTR